MVDDQVLSFNYWDNKKEETDFERLFETLQHSIISYGLRILNDRYLIENIVQDAFLKLWQFRETITSHEHAEGFLKQSVKWGCHSYFSNRKSRFHRYMIKLDEYNNCEMILEAACSDPFHADAEDDLFEHRLKQVYEAIEHVFYGREKEVMELHFIKGHSHTQIADRYGLSVRTVTVIIDKGKLRLQAVAVTEPRSSSRSQKQSDVGLGLKLDSIEGLDPEKNTIYQLRTIGKYNFDQIASFLHLPISYVQCEYVMAWKIVAWQKKKKKQIQSHLLSA